MKESEQLLAGGVILLALCPASLLNILIFSFFVIRTPLPPSELLPEMLWWMKLLVGEVLVGVVLAVAVEGLGEVLLGEELAVGVPGGLGVEEEDDDGKTLDELRN